MYVYFIQAGQYVKIGKAINPEHRLTELQVGNPIELKLLGKLPCKSQKNAEHMEYSLQRMFNKINTRGEWFHCGPVASMVPHLLLCSTVDEMCKRIRQLRRGK